MRHCCIQILLRGFTPKIGQHAYPSCVGNGHHSLFHCTSCSWPAVEEWFYDSIPNAGDDQVYMPLFHVMCRHAIQAWSAHAHLMVARIIPCSKIPYAWSAMHAYFSECRTLTSNLTRIWKCCHLITDPWISCNARCEAARQAYFYWVQVGSVLTKTHIPKHACTSWFLWPDWQ
jgi:hypothetical protein